MSAIEVKIIADSVNPCGNRLTTIVATFPRFILPQVLTHRMFSRNTSSSRAKPVRYMIDMVESDPQMPLQWMSNKRGMQPGGPLANVDARIASKVWRDAARCAVEATKALGIDLNVAKEQANRLLEPFATTQMLISATEWDNFFRLRIHGDAQKEIRVLAEKIRDAIESSEPEEVEAGRWHLPFIDEHERYALELSEALKVSTARCARVSYYLPSSGKRSDLVSDMRLFDKLMSDPPHASAFEHQAMALASPERIGNFYGWVQHRKFIKGENA